MRAYGTLLGLYILCGLVFSICSSACENPRYDFVLVDPATPESPFLFSVGSEDLNAIQSLEGYTDSEGNILRDDHDKPAINVAKGLLRRSNRAPQSEHAWSFEFIPHTLEFSDFAPISCDGSFEMVENNLDYWLVVKKAEFCPWQTKNLIREVTKSCVDTRQEF